MTTNIYKRKNTLIIVVILLGFTLTSLKPEAIHIDDSQVISYIINPQEQSLRFYWKDKSDSNYSNFNNLEIKLKQEGETLIFAMNGGMYNKDGSPQGLYIEEGIQKALIDTINSGYGNFYLQPNGIFSIDNNNTPNISTTTTFKNNNIKYATQSGPMLLINGKLHPKFNDGSKNVHIRNGVGILKNGDLLFAISKKKVNFFDFASYFKNRGCKNALYLDGFVSQIYLPSDTGVQTEGNFGVIIGEIE